MELTELLRKYDTILNLKYRSEQTKIGYKNALKRFIKDNSRIYRMSSLDIQSYMSDFRLKYSDSYFNVVGSALKLLFIEVLKQPRKMDWFSPVKVDRTFHNIVTHNQFINVMKSAKNIKHKTIIIILYSTGIRESELINIKLDDVNINEGRLFVKSLKNGKNRFIPLHELTIKYIKAYLKCYNPTKYFLNGQSSLKYSVSSIRNICKNNSDGKIYPHLFRHTYLTNVIEKEDVFAAMELAGHRNLSSTLHYNHISSDRKLYNPLDKCN